MIQEVSSVDPVLMPLLRRDLLCQGMGHSVRLGDKLVDYNPAFKLVLTTRDASISLTPDVKPHLAVANFTVTRSALESQLLAFTIQHEQPQLESKRRCAALF